MPRAHRWEPDAIVAVSTAKNNTNSTDDKNNNENDSSSSTKLPTVVFCPHAAKGSQNASAAAQRSSSKNEDANSSEKQQQEGNQPVAVEATTTNTKKPGSSSSRNPDDIVTATAFWLVDQDINRVIGRLEKEGLVAILQMYLTDHPLGAKIIGPMHTASHVEYRNVVLQNLKTEGQKKFFMDEFVTTPDLTKRKFGNMAVSGELDLKCAHALSAQYLANITCPLGELVIKFIIHLAKKTNDKVSDEKVKTEDENEKEDDDEADKDKKNIETQNDEEKDWRDNLMPLFKEFVDNILENKPGELTGKFHQRIQIANENNSHNLATHDATEVVESAKNILAAFLEKGEGVGRRRKRRTD